MRNSHSLITWARRAASTRRAFDGREAASVTGLAGVGKPPSLPVNPPSALSRVGADGGHVSTEREQAVAKDGTLRGRKRVHPSSGPCANCGRAFAHSADQRYHAARGDNVYCERECMRKHRAPTVERLRFRQMRASARHDGKAVPAYEDLERWAAACGMVCPVCRRVMNWLRKDGTDTVVTLQHDRDGTMRLLCFSCNARHVGFDGDSFYELGPQGKKRCPQCGAVKDLATGFYRLEGVWGNRQASCKECSAATHREWCRRRRDYVNAKRRERRARLRVSAKEAGG